MGANESEVISPPKVRFLPRQDRKLWPFIAMVGNSVEDEELRAAAEFVRNELFLAVLPHQIPEDAAKRLTEGRQMFRQTTTSLSGG